MYEFPFAPDVLAPGERPHTSDHRPGIPVFGKDIIASRRVGGHDGGAIRPGGIQA